MRSTVRSSVAQRVSMNEKEKEKRWERHVARGRGEGSLDQHVYRRGVPGHDCLRLVGAVDRPVYAVRHELRNGTQRSGRSQPLSFSMLGRLTNITVEMAIIVLPTIANLMTFQLVASISR